MTDLTTAELIEKLDRAHRMSSSRPDAVTTYGQARDALIAAGASDRDKPDLTSTDIAAIVKDAIKESRTIDQHGTEASKIISQVSLRVFEALVGARQ